MNKEFETHLIFELLPDGSGYSVFAKQSCDNPFDVSILKIPEVHNSLPVKEIAPNGFNHCDSLTEVELPNTTIKINDDGFHRCENLCKINIPDSVEYIGARAFYFCLKLQGIAFGKNVKTIGDNCFQRCESLGNIELPTSLDFVGKEILINCLSTQNIYFSFVPATISPDAFKFKYLRNIYFRMPVNEFIKNAVSYPRQFLQNTYALENGVYVKIKEEDLNKYNQENSEKLFINYPIVPNKQFKGSTFIKEVIIGPNVKEIGYSAFRDCINLSKITINHGLQKIGSNAFDGTGLEIVELPETVVQIEDNAFSNIKNLKRISFPENVEYFESWLSNCNPNVMVKWPNHVNRLSKYGLISSFSFYNLETMVIPEGIQCIPTGFVEGNRFIKQVVFPKSLKEIKPQAFKKCSNLESVVLNNKTTLVASNAFSGCDKLVLEENSDYPVVKCRDGVTRVKTILSYKNKKKIKELFKTEELLLEAGGIFKNNPGDYDNVYELIESFLGNKKNAMLFSKATLLDYSPSNKKENIAIHDGYKCLCFDKLNVNKIQMDAFKSIDCVGLFYKTFHCDLAIIKTSKMDCKDLWSSYYYDNEDYNISCYITDDNGETYWLIHNWYDC